MVKTSNLGLNVLMFLKLFLFHLFECFTCIYEHVCLDPAEGIRFPFSVSHHVSAGNQTEILYKNKKFP